MALHLDDKISRASKAFGALRKSILSRQIKKMICQVVVMGVIMYATETWPAKRKNIRRLKGLSPSYALPENKSS